MFHQASALSASPRIRRAPSPEVPSADFFRHDASSTPSHQTGSDDRFPKAPIPHRSAHLPLPLHSGSDTEIPPVPRSDRRRAPEDWKVQEKPLPDTSSDFLPSIPQPRLPPSRTRNRSPPDSRLPLRTRSCSASVDIQPHRRRAVLFPIPPQTAPVLPAAQTTPPERPPKSRPSARLRSFPSKH